MYSFTIRGQKFEFATRTEYLEAFAKSLDIAQEQEAQISGPQAK